MGECRVMSGLGFGVTLGESWMELEQVESTDFGGKNSSRLPRQLAPKTNRGNELFTVLRRWHTAGDRVAP